MTKSQSIVIIGAGHNGLVCATYLARAGHRVQILEAREGIGGAASNRSFAEGYNVSGLAHILYSLNPKVCKDLNLASAGLDVGHGIDTISLDHQGRHLTLAAQAVSGEGLSRHDIEAYAAFKKEFLAYAKALEPLMMNKPPRLKDMDLRDKLTLARIGWNLRFGLGTNSMREFLRVGGINIYDVLNDVFTDARLKGAIAADAVIGHQMGPRTPSTVLTYLNRLRGEIHSSGARVLRLGCFKSAHIDTLSVTLKVTGSICTAGKVNSRWFRAPATNLFVRPGCPKNHFTIRQTIKPQRPQNHWTSRCKRAVLGPGRWLSVSLPADRPAPVLMRSGLGAVEGPVSRRHRDHGDNHASTIHQNRNDPKAYRPQSRCEY